MKRYFYSDGKEKQGPFSLEELKNTNAIYSQFKAFQQKNIYSYMNNKGETGGIIYFELSPTRPDLVLKDLIKIASCK